jgi:hypothetical protein
MKKMKYYYSARPNNLPIDSVSLSQDSAAGASSRDGRRRRLPRTAATATGASLTRTSRPLAASPQLDFAATAPLPHFEGAHQQAAVAARSIRDGAASQPQPPATPLRPRRTRLVYQRAHSPPHRASGMVVSSAVV